MRKVILDPAVTPGGFIDAGLIDVYRLSVHPVALGSGKPLFRDLQQRVQLRLIRSNTFRSGVVQLIYEPA